MYTITIEKQVDLKHPVAVITIHGADLNKVRESYRKEYDNKIISAVVTLNGQYLYRIM